MKRLSSLRAAFVIARRDFVAILFSRAFLFFLLGPLFPLIVGGLAGGIGASVADANNRPTMGVMMSSSDFSALTAASARLRPNLGDALPPLVRIDSIQTDPAAALSGGKELAAVLSGTLEAPVLTGTSERIEAWKGRVSILAAEATRATATTFPPVALHEVTTSRAKARQSRMVTAQAGQTVLFLLIMMLAGMVLSNLVEEKANKIIEVLAAAVPMDAVFMGKLFAMLGVSLVGIAVWAGTIGLGAAAVSAYLPAMTAPAVGWPIFILLGVLYFSAGYLLLGSIFLAIGALATTVREVQTLSMPVTMMQLLVFFFATYAMGQSGKPVELAAIVFPLSSPFAMFARAAREPALLPHLLALCWQALWVVVFIKTGAALFRKRVLKSGPARPRSKRNWFGKSPSHG